MVHRHHRLADIVGQGGVALDLRAQHDLVGLADIEGRRLSSRAMFKPRTTASRSSGSTAGGIDDGAPPTDRGPKGHRPGSWPHIDADDAEAVAERDREARRVAVAGIITSWRSGRSMSGRLLRKPCPSAGSWREGRRETGRIPPDSTGRGAGQRRQAVGQVVSAVCIGTSVAVVVEVGPDGRPVRLHPLCRAGATAPCRRSPAAHQHLGRGDGPGGQHHLAPRG